MTLNSRCGMERTMLRGIKERAEQLRPDQTDSPGLSGCNWPCGSSPVKATAAFDTTTRLPLPAVPS